MNAGYMNKILTVELTAGKLESAPFPDNWRKEYIGGGGVAARIIYDEVPPQSDAFDPSNVVCIFTGPYTGTSAPFSGRYSVAAKSPLTGGWGEASCSGYWAPELKFAGFDGIVVKGSSENPVYLWINDGKAELLPADDLWGKTTTETENILRKRHGGKTKVLSIGPAGENLVRFSSVISDGGRAAARCGIGAVMGSKRIKAIAVIRGSKREVPVANKELLTSLSKEYAKTAGGSPAGEIMAMGTAATVEGAEQVGDFPIKNWQLGSHPEASRLDFSGDYQKIFVKKWPCYRCPIGCGRWVKIDKEIAGVKPFEGHGPEYETLGVLGGALQNMDVETVAAANHLCNDYGMDTISTGGMIAFAFEAYEKGILTKDDIGFELKWGDGEAVVKLTAMIAKREGIGELLGEGPVKASQKIGKGSEEFALHVKGMGIPAHDPRVYSGVALEYAVSNRGACHLQGFMETWQSMDAFFADEFGMDKAEIAFWGGDYSGLHSDQGKGKAVALSMAVCNVLDALPVCKFMPFLDLFSGHEITNLTKAITGMEITRETLVTIGERMVNLKRAFNIRCGLTKGDDRLPQRLLQPAPDVLDKHGAPNLEVQMKEFYEAMSWDWETGKPTEKRLRELGLEDVAEDLW